MASSIDPITFSVVLNRFNSIASEMTLVLERAAMTAILALSRDYSCCIYDARGRQVAMVDAIPVHTSSMSMLLNEVTKAFGDNIFEGDVIVVNSAYHGNTHIGDLVALVPVFIEGEHRFWAAAKGHQLDVGASVPSSVNEWADNIWQEGLQLPPIKFYERGVPRTDVIAMYLANVRYADLLRGDLMAQFGSVWTAERRLHQLCEEFGGALVVRYADEIIDYTNRRARAAIREIPNGIYIGESWMDSDAKEQQNLLVRATVTVEDETIHVDFAGTAPQVPSGHNASLGVCVAQATAAIAMMFDADIPRNEGCFDLITVTAPEGSMVNPIWPASTASATTQPGDVIAEAVTKALTPVIPSRVRAGTAHWSNVPNLSGTDPDTGVAWGHLMLNGGGGGGAADGADGWPLWVCVAASGGLKIPGIEHSELLYPLHFERWEVAADSMGLGEYIGGPGVRVTVSPTADEIEWIQVNDSLINQPHGANGGTPGAGGGHYLEPTVDSPRRFLPPAVFATLGSGDRWTGVSSGGGGWGDPLRRSAEQVQSDVRDGMYGIDAARDVFGVVLMGAADSPTIAATETEALRASLRAARASNPLVAITPTAPGTGSWVATHTQTDDLFIASAIDARKL
ncbi:hydantoinase B/oxoprolinase family protein [Nocardioides sp. AN3]